MNSPSRMPSVCLDAITFGSFWGIRKLLSSCSLGFWQEHAFLWICKLEHFLQSEMSGNFPNHQVLIYVVWQFFPQFISFLSHLTTRRKKESGCPSTLCLESSSVNIQVHHLPVLLSTQLQDTQRGTLSLRDQVLCPSSSNNVLCTSSWALTSRTSVL